MLAGGASVQTGDPAQVLHNVLPVQQLTRQPSFDQDGTLITLAIATAVHLWSYSNLQSLCYSRHRVFGCSIAASLQLAFWETCTNSPHLLLAKVCTRAPFGQARAIAPASAAYSRRATSALGCSLCCYSRPAGGLSLCLLLLTILLLLNRTIYRFKLCCLLPHFWSCLHHTDASVSPCMTGGHPQNKFLSNVDVRSAQGPNKDSCIKLSLWGCPQLLHNVLSPVAEQY